MAEPAAALRARAKIGRRSWGAFQHRGCDQKRLMRMPRPLLLLPPPPPPPLPPSLWLTLRAPAWPSQTLRGAQVRLTGAVRTPQYREERNQPMLKAMAGGRGQIDDPRQAMAEKPETRRG
jgi:hypothetical protein